MQTTQTKARTVNINFVILADGDAVKRFEPQDIAMLTVDSLSHGNNFGNKIVYILEKDLERLLACLDPKLYDECKRLKQKPERSYRFIKRLLADNPDATRIAVKIARLIGGTNGSGKFK